MPEVRVPLHGELDATTSSSLRTSLLDAIQGHPGATIVVDLDDVSFMDSTALGALVGALRLAAASGGSVKVLDPHPRVAKVFELTGLSSLFGLNGDYASR
jgi:anti-sigma B factor antagonist